MFLTKQTRPVSTGFSTDFGFHKINEALMMFDLAQKDAVIQAMHEEFQMISESGTNMSEEGKASELFNKVKEFFKKLIASLKETFKKVKEAVKKYVSNFLDWVTKKSRAAYDRFMAFFKKNPNATVEVSELNTEEADKVLLADLNERERLQKRLAAATDEKEIAAIRKEIAALTKKKEDAEKAYAKIFAAADKKLKKDIKTLESDIKKEQKQLDARTKAVQKVQKELDEALNAVDKLEAQINSAVDKADSPAAARAEAEIKLAQTRETVTLLQSKLRTAEMYVRSSERKIAKWTTEVTGKKTTLGEEGDDSEKELSEDDDVEDMEEVSEDDDVEEELSEAIMAKFLS